MTTVSEPDSSVDDFLKTISLLGEKRNREDDERTRKLEAEILQGRKERQARRAENARSIASSPRDSLSNVYSARGDRSPTSGEIGIATKEIVWSSTSSTAGEMERPQSRGGIQQAEKIPSPNGDGQRSPENTSSSSILPSRSSTLSWQRRPTSRDSNSLHHRPTTNILPEAPNLAPPSQSGDQSPEELTRSQIKQSLSSKDPLWFRQTAERGIGSAAYRKSNDSSETFVTDGSMRLPGLTRDFPSESYATNSEALSNRPASPSRANSLRTTGSLGKRGSGYSSASDGGTVQLSALPSSSSQALQTPQDDTGFATDDRSPNRIAMSPAQGRMSADRPASPTKGLGGFVQSAMLKRSDSINKRWKIDAPPGLTRADSVASNRSTASTTKGPRSPQRESRLLDSNRRSPTPSSRPISSPESDTTIGGLNRDRDVTNSDPNLLAEEPLTTSPSKTMDPKRWSPTKASWLESALSRPESPTKNLSTPTQQQSDWKINNQKAKDAENIGLKGRNNSTHEIGDLKNPTLEIGVPNDFVHKSREKTDVTLESHSVPLKRKQKLPLNSEALPEGVGPTGMDDKLQQDIDLAVERPMSKPQHKPLSGRTEERNASAMPVGSKPNTPPKPSFRAKLKPKGTVGDDQNSNGQLEFQNVFGKLKRAETKNYVAPDELKNSILRGKAGLSVTGGPKKTQRVDEFKESILKQKAAMKEGSGTTIKRTPGSTIGTTGKPSPALPEALSKREQMSRSSSAQSDQAVKDSSVDKSSFGKEDSMASTSSQGSKTETGRGIDMPKPSLAKNLSHASDINETKSDGVAKILDPEPTTVPITRTIAVNYPRPEPHPVSALADTQASKSSQNAKARSLAERLNPSLASLISRGSGQASKSTDQNGQSKGSISLGDSQVEQAADAPHRSSLTHATKGRAKGPKRRLPNVGQRIDVVTTARQVEKGDLDDEAGEPKYSLAQSKPSVTQSTPSRPLAKLISESDETHEASNAKPRKTILEPNALETKPSVPNLPELEHNVKVNPAVAPKSPELRKVSSPKQAQNVGSDGHPNTNTGRIIGPETPEDPMKSAKALWDRPNSPGVPKSLHSPKLPRPDSPSKGSLPQTGETKEQSLILPKGKTFQRHDTKLRDSKLSNSELSLTDWSSTENQSPTPIASNKTAKANSTPRLLTKLFTQVPSTSITGSFDTDKILHSQTAHNQSTAQTIHSQVSQLDSSGKATPLPAYKEHILFENGIYVCIYIYHPAQQPLEKHTEVFLWIGDQVPEAAYEDVQLFGRKTAREYNTKLQVLRQGKEPPNFLQAIAGVLLVRRNRSDEQYMLSTRAHGKHLAFDEVDFDARSLCSGFPYLIKARSGQQYLWKGKGSTADELGIARLIGMDLGLTGEPLEIEEGTEPDHFFVSFPPPRCRNEPSPWDAHWSLKPRLPRYRTFLYRVSVEPNRPTSTISSLWGRRGSSPPKNRTFTANIAEIQPFAQRDLESRQIYVLDAYFEIFVLVTPQSSSRHIEFTTALLFAQEYAILVTSMQDRPAMPAGTVVFPSSSSSSSSPISLSSSSSEPDGDGETVEELPPGIRETFRKWDPSAGIASEIKRWRVMKLERVLEACERERGNDQNR